MSGAAITITPLFAEARARRRRRRLVLAAVVASAAAVIVASRPPAPPPPSAAPVHVGRLALTRPPYVGVACPGAPNSIACDRVGIAVFVRRAPAELVATIGGRSVALRDMHMRCSQQATPCDRFFTGYLTHAGLLDGALRVTPDRAPFSWYGRTPVSGRVTLRATYRDGRVAEATRRVALSPGWG